MLRILLAATMTYVTIALAVALMAKITIELYALIDKEGFEKNLKESLADTDIEFDEVKDEMIKQVKGIAMLVIGFKWPVTLIKKTLGKEN